MRRASRVDTMESFELFSDRTLRAGAPLVARLSGRRFDELLENGGFARPFDPRFGKAMVKTLTHLATNLGATFGYVERTEMSLYANSSGGDARRLLSRICGEASAKLSL